MFSWRIKYLKRWGKLNRYISLSCNMLSLDISWQRDFRTCHQQEFFEMYSRQKKCKQSRVYWKTRDRIIAYKTPGRFETIGFAFEARRWGSYYRCLQCQSSVSSPGDAAPPSNGAGTWGFWWGRTKTGKVATRRWVFPILTGVVIHMIQCLYITGDLDDDQNGYQLCSAINACPWDPLCVKNYLISAFKICIHSLPIMVL